MASGKKLADGSLDDVLTGLNAQYGAGTVMMLGEEVIAPVSVIPSGSIALDEALGVGGFPRGRIIEIYGPESSGKTSLALTAAGNAQRQGLAVAVIDAEHALDPAWCDALGVDTARLVVSQPSSGEQALQIAEKLTLSRKVGLIVIDSVSALVPKAELEGEIGDSHVGLQARMMSQALRKLAGVASATETTIVFINQLREKVGVFFGNPETTSGGKALKFYASVRIDVRRIETLRDKDVAYGIKVRAKVVKNKVAPPFRIAEFDFLFSSGISRSAELLELGVERGVVRKAGSHYAYGGEALGNGKVAARQFLDGHADVLAAVDTAVRGAVQPGHERQGCRGGSPRDGLAMDGPGPFDEPGT